MNDPLPPPSNPLERVLYRLSLAMNGYTSLLTTTSQEVREILTILRSSQNGSLLIGRDLARLIENEQNEQRALEEIRRSLSDIVRSLSEQQLKATETAINVKESREDMREIKKDLTPVHGTPIPEEFVKKEESSVAKIIEASIVLGGAIKRYWAYLAFAGSVLLHFWWDKVATLFQKR